VVRIALDAMGGDFAPSVPVAGALAALEELPASCELTLVGHKAEIEAALQKHGTARDRLSIVDAPETIEMNEKPLAAVRGKRQSSIRVGLELHKAGKVDAFVSAGNTGATMAASTLLLGLYPGIRRPAIAAVFPTALKPVLLLDVGANIACGHRELSGFAHLGAVFARVVLNREDPSIGLLNIGEEEEKGGQAVRDAFELLAEDPGLRFLGNVEGGDILSGDCDVIVCDGFVGNVVLKFAESVARMFISAVEREVGRDSLDSGALARLRRAVDHSETGGAPLLGVKGVSVVCHGRSSASAVKNAIKVAVQSVESGLSEFIGAELARVVA
jgi:glycerol-3-phosphate acyltransferase PlsX